MKILQSPQEVLLIWASLHLPLLLIPIFQRWALNVLQLSNIEAEEFNNHGTVKAQGEKQLHSGPVTEPEEVLDCKLLQQNLDKVPRADRIILQVYLPSFQIILQVSSYHINQCRLCISALSFSQPLSQPKISTTTTAHIFLLRFSEGLHNLVTTKLVSHFIFPETKLHIRWFTN